VRVGQALADVATISLLHERGMRRSDATNEQPQTTLNSRGIIEQAKASSLSALARMLSSVTSHSRRPGQDRWLNMGQAFSLLRDHARARNLRLSDLALAFIDGSEPLTSLTASGQRQQNLAPGGWATSPRRASRPGRRFRTFGNPG
jgi:hypothetical protein